MLTNFCIEREIIAQTGHCQGHCQGQYKERKFTFDENMIAKYLSQVKGCNFLLPADMNNRAFRCTNGDFYVALGSRMGSALLVWVGSWYVKTGFILFW